MTAPVPVQQATPQQLGARLRPPPAFTPDGALLAPGRLADSGTSPPLRCELASGAAQRLSPHNWPHDSQRPGGELPDGSVFIADARPVAQTGFAGALFARRHATAAAPGVGLDAGLLLGQQRVGAGALGAALRERIVRRATRRDHAAARRRRLYHTAVMDFLRQGDQWWALLGNESDQAPELFRFDSS